MLTTGTQSAYTPILVGRFGPAAVAGYGTGSRLESLLVPLVFGLGGPLVAIVGTNIGAGQRDRALRATWIGAAIAAGLCEAIRCVCVCVCRGCPPRVRLSLFDPNPAMLDAGLGSRYLHTVGPLYGLFGLQPLEQVVMRDGAHRALEAMQWMEASRGWMCPICQRATKR